MQQDRIIRMGLAGLGLAHELNGPLTSTALALALLEERMTADPPPSAAEVVAELRRVQGAVQRMIELVAHLRALARGERLGVAPVALDAVADTALRLVRPALAGLGAVEVVRGARSAVVVQADALLLEQALICLILNGAEAAKARVEVVVEADGLVVSDDGPGFLLPDEAGQSSKVRGMGVGLALARLIAQDAGGELVVESGAEGGARVKLRFT